MTESDDARDDRVLDLIDHCAELYAGPYRTTKQIFIDNESELDGGDTRTQENLEDILEHTDNFFEKLHKQNIDEAEEELGRLENHMYTTVCEAARVLPESLYREVKINRIQTYWGYKILLFSEVPRLHHHRAEIVKIEECMRNAERKDQSQWKDCIEKYNQAKKRSKGLNDKTPKKSQVIRRSFVIVTGLITIGGAVANQAGIISVGL